MISASPSIPSEFSPNDKLPLLPHEGEELSVRRILQVLRQRKQIVIWSVIVCTLSAAILSFMMVPYFRASTTIEIQSKQSSAVADVLGQIASDFSGEQDLKTEIQTDVAVLQSASLNLETIQRVHYEDHLVTRWKHTSPGHRIPSESGIPLSSAPFAREAILERFESHVVIAPVPSTRLITIGFDDPDPVYAAEVVNALINQFVVDRLGRRNASTLQASDWMSSEIATLNKQVQEAQERLITYQSKSGLISVPGTTTGGSRGSGGTPSDSVSNPLLERLSRVNQDLAGAESNRIMREAIYRVMKTGDQDAIADLANQQSGLTAGGSAQAENFGALEALRQQQNAINQEITSAIAKYGSKNPHLLDLNRRLDEVNRQMQEATNREVAQAKADYDVSLQAENGMRNAYESLEHEANQMNDSQIRLAILRQEVDSSQAVYNDLYTKLQESKLAGGTQASNVSVISPALPPAKSIYPKGGVNLLIGLISGLFLGIALAFLMNSIDDTVTSGLEVEHFTGLPLLGNIPKFTSTDAGIMGLAAKRDDIQPDEQAQEALRSLRTVLLLSRPGSHPRRLILTSSLPNEGKTTIAFNLAKSFAQSSRRVLILDTDLRRPSLHKMAHVNNQAGLSNLLTSGTNLEDLILPVPDTPNLFLLPAGPVPPNPAELLASPEFVKVMTQLDAMFDLIVLDTPPLMMFSDAIILSPLVDGIILVVRWGATTRNVTKRAVEALTRNNIRPRGFVMNAVDTKSTEHYYNYGYYGNKYGREYYGTQRS